MTVKNSGRQVAHTLLIQKTHNSSRIRRSRGYNWEGTLVKRFNSLESWSAYRLGSTTTSMPDVIALNPEDGAAFIIEAKSGTTNRLVVPAEQIERCIEWFRVLAPFRDRHIVLAFKFLSKRRVGLDTYSGRQLREYYKEWDVSARLAECVCLYDGTTYGRDGDRRVRLELKECDVPTPKRSPRQDI